MAEAAGVDSALVVRTFGGKAGLFRAAVEWPWNPADVVPAVAAGPRGTTGRRIATMFVETWEHPEERAPIITLLRSAAAHQESRNLLNQFVTTQVLVPIVRTAGFDRPEQRAAFIAPTSSEPGSPATCWRSSRWRAWRRRSSATSSPAWCSGSSPSHSPDGAGRRAGGSPR